MNAELILLNDIYRSVLNRDVDQSGIDTYLPRLKANIRTGKATIEQDLLSSEEYRNLNGHNIDSGSGDRSSYINQNDLSIINHSTYKNIIEFLISEIIYLDNPKYPESKLQNRIDTIKKSIIFSGKKNLSFTIFPHMEYDFCTDKFNDSLRDITNYRYFTLYFILSCFWKLLFDKTVHTCGTISILNKMLQKIKISPVNSAQELISTVSEDIIRYLSIRICGRELSSDELLTAQNYISQSDSNGLIDFLLKIDLSIKNKENSDAISNITALSKTLGRKPKVLIMVAYLETQNQYFIQKMMYHLNKVKEINSLLDIDFALDNERIDKESSDYTPWSRVKRIRNLMIDKYPIHDYDYLYIIDSDIIDYPHNFLTRAIGLNPTGITAPLALIQNSVVFYDWCGYQRKGATNLYGEYRSEILVKSSSKRNFNLQPPYVNDSNRLVEIDCVGCTYVVPTTVFKQTYGNMQQELIDTFDIAGVKNHKIQENIVQYEDHPSFTDHYTVCAAVRANGGKIIMDRGSAAYHADLPIHGEAWH